MYDAYWSARGAQPKDPLSNFSVGGMLGSGFTSGLGYGVSGAVLGGLSGGPVGALVGGIAGFAAGAAFGMGGYLWDTFNVGDWITGNTNRISAYDFKRPIVNTKLAATSRQAAMQSIMSSARNYRQYLGREAAKLHA